ncbi:cytochrome P450, partial [Micromonospora sp. KC207]
MASIPADRSPDSTLALLREGYRFIGDRCDRYDTDIFQARLRLEQTICLRGREAAALFYDPERFVRAGATPKRVQRTLTGAGGV